MPYCIESQMPGWRLLTLFIRQWGASQWAYFRVSIVSVRLDDSGSGLRIYCSGETGKQSGGYYNPSLRYWVLIQAELDLTMMLVPIYFSKYNYRLG